MTRLEDPVGPRWGFGLYVHWPYCARICPYCDFNVYAAKDRDPAPLADALIADLKVHAATMPDHGPLETIYFGGGTPSLLPPDRMAALVAAADAAFGVAPGAEITLEANPNDVLRSRLEDWQAAGINRLSVGVQSLRDTALRFLGRDHDAAAAVEAARRAVAAFPNTSIDLIYARPGQSAAEWEEELAEALALGAPHLSLYELTIEARTAFARAVARGAWTPADEDAQADLYDVTQRVAEAHGLPAYEVSNHARRPETRSRHNQIYWNSGDWIGLGPGAHGRLTRDGARRASEAPSRPEAYIDAVAAGETGWNGALPLTPADVAAELLAMGLRTAEGVALSRLGALTGALPARPTRQALVDTGLLLEADGWIRLTASGRLFADRISGDLHAAMSPEAAARTP